MFNSTLFLTVYCMVVGQTLPRRLIRCINIFEFYVFPTAVVIKSLFVEKLYKKDVRAEFV